MGFLKGLVKTLAGLLSFLIITMIIAYLFGGFLKIMYKVLGVKYNDDMIFNHSWLVTIIWSLSVIFFVFFGVYIDSMALAFAGFRLLFLGIFVLFIGLFGAFID